MRSKTDQIEYGNIITAHIISFGIISSQIFSLIFNGSGRLWLASHVLTIAIRSARLKYQKPSIWALNKDSAKDRFYFNCSARICAHCEIDGKLRKCIATKRGIKSQLETIVPVKQTRRQKILGPDSDPGWPRRVMATAMLTAWTLPCLASCAPNAIRVSRGSGARDSASLRLNSMIVSTCAAIDESSASLEQARRGEGISRRGAVLAAARTAFAGSLVSTLAHPPTSGATQLKQTNLPIEDVKKVVEDDFVRRNYLVTGNMTQSIYNDNCGFQDPTGLVIGVDSYSKAVKALFDPKGSRTELLNIEVSGPRTIDVKFRISGYMNFPWRPFIAPFVGSSRYTVGDDGLIESYHETWSISLLDAFAQFATPSFLLKDNTKL